MTRTAPALLLSLALASAGCREEISPAPVASAPAASVPPGQGSRMGQGHRMQGMGFGSMQGMMGGGGGGMGAGMGAGAGGPAKGPPWHLTPEQQVALEARRAALPAPTPPASVAALEAMPAAPPGRCAEVRRTHLFVLHGDTLVRSQPVAEAMASPEAFELPAGQAPARRALPLLALVPPDVRTGEVVVYPCTGERFRVPVQALRAEPNRYSLTETPRGVLRLVDATQPRGAEGGQIRNIAAILVL